MDQKHADFYNEMVRVLLPMDNHQICIILDELRRWSIPQELKHIPPFDEKDKLETEDLIYYQLIKEFIEEIIPSQELKKHHYRNLLKKDFNFGSVMLFDIKIKNDIQEHSEKIDNNY